MSHFENFKKVRIEYHILQSFPVSCLNRDDVGAPKTALIGGVTRARVSSQCWKRQVRLTMQDVGLPLAIRTKHLSDLIYYSIMKAEHARVETYLDTILDNEHNQRAAAIEAEKLAAIKRNAMICSKVIAEKLAVDTLLFISPSEIKALVQYARAIEFNPTKVKDKEVSKIAKDHLNLEVDGLDMALFGRMVAKAPELNIEAAASFSHAISTHQVSNEIEFFTAMDDINREGTTAHIGNFEFNSATYYRYISLDLGQLEQSLVAYTPSIEENGNFDYIIQKQALMIELMKSAVHNFTQALFTAIPTARQSTLAAACPWEYATVLVRKGQGIQIPFEAPIAAGKEGYLKPSIDYIRNYLDKKRIMFGSLFGALGEYTLGDYILEEDDIESFDELVEALLKHIKIEP